MIFISVSYIYSTMYMYLYFDNFLLSEWFLVWCFVCESWNIRMLTCFYSSEAANLCNQDYIQIVTVWFIYPFYCRCNLSELTSAFYNICSNSLKVFVFLPEIWVSLMIIDLYCLIMISILSFTKTFVILCRQVKTHNLKTLL